LPDATLPLLQASSAYKHSLKEVLALPAISSKIKDTKAAREVSALQDFYAMLTADSSRAFYGPGHVLAAAELGAIQTLLISGQGPHCSRAAESLDMPGFLYSRVQGSGISVRAMSPCPAGG